MSMLTELICQVAKSYEGIYEVNGNNMDFSNPEFANLLKGRGWLPGQAYCVYTAELIWIEAFEKSGLTQEAKLLNNLFSANAVMNFENFKNYKLKDPGKAYFYEISNNPHRGGIIIWQLYHNWEPTTSGHAGVIQNRVKDKIETTEGNTGSNGSREGDGIYRKVRSLSMEPKKAGLVIKGFINIII